MGEEKVEEFWIIPDLWFEDWSEQKEKKEEVFDNVCVNVRRWKVGVEPLILVWGILSLGPQMNTMIL